MSDEREALDGPPKAKEKAAEESSSVFDAFTGKKAGDGADFFSKLFGSKRQEGGGEDEEADGDDEDEKEQEEESADNCENKKEAIRHKSSFFNMFPKFSASKQKGKEKDDESGGGLNSMIFGARKMAFSSDRSDDSMKTSETSESLDRFMAEFKFVGEVLKKNFSHLKLEDLNPLALLYYLEFEDSRKTPSWKRRRHRFLPDIDKDTVYGIHDALYLSELSYLDSHEEIEEGLKNFVGSASHELVYCSVKGGPREPANFVAIRRESAKKKKKGGFMWWGGGDNEALEVVLVVRGTKELGDVLSDAMLDASEYRDGISHEGVTEAGKFVANKHLDLFQYLLKESGKEKLDITIVGHSLGKLRQQGANSLYLSSFLAADHVFYLF